MQLINTHCHSNFTGHGEGEISEYIAEGEAAGLSTLAFTEHYPLSNKFDPTSYVSISANNLQAYIQSVENARSMTKIKDVILGIEIDYLGTDEDRAITSKDLEIFELVLGSVHFVGSRPFDNPDSLDEWKEPGAVDSIWRRYIDTWCEMAADNSLRIDVLSHPDLAKKFAFYPSFNLLPEYEKMAEAARAGNRMIEVNTSGSYYACKEMFPALPLLQAFQRAGIPCTVGTDAHIPRNIARDIQKAYKLMYDAGYKKVTVPTRKRDRREFSL